MNDLEIKNVILEIFPKLNNDDIILLIYHTSIIIDSIQKSDANNEKHFCIFDELYSGTNPEEAVKSANAFLKYLQTFSNVDFMLTTHYKKICKNFKKSSKIENYKMGVSIKEDGSFNYSYQLKKGISNIKGGIRVLKDMEYPEEILKEFED